MGSARFSHRASTSCSAGQVNTATSYPRLLRSLGEPRPSRPVKVVEGKLPASIRGFFLRNGPDFRWDPIFPDDTHWFDGDGLVHFVRLSGESDEAAAEYGAAYVDTQGFQEEARAGKAKYCGLRQSPIGPLIAWGLYSKLSNWILKSAPDRPYWVIQQKNTANNGLMTTGGSRILATYEAGSPYEIRLVRDEGGKTRMETVGLYIPKADADAGLAGPLPSYNPLLHNFTAHSKICSRTGECIFISYDLIGRKFHVGIMDSGDRLLSMHTYDFVDDQAVMMHDFAITETKIVIFSHPLKFNLPQSMRGGLPFTYDRSAPSYFGVIDRTRSPSDASTSSGIAWIPAENCYCYHVMAAFDDKDDDQVHLFAQKLEETGALGMATAVEGGREVPNFRPKEVATLHKWTLRTAQGGPPRVMESKEMCDLLSDFCEINPQYVGRECAYGYSLRMSREKNAGGGIPLFDGLIKHDLGTGEYEVLEMDEDKVIDDLTFVVDDARPRAEDSGWLMFFSHSLSEEKSWLEIVDAADISAGSVATVELPFIPLGFHATWVPEEYAKN